MTTERKAYLAKCSERELWLRENIRHWQGLIQGNKWALNNDKQFTEDDKLYCLSHIRKYKYQVSVYRHELARLKGMDRVVVPFHTFIRDIEDGCLVEYEVWNCPKCNLMVGGDLIEHHNYCPNCGRRILWEKVK